MVSNTNQARTITKSQALALRSQAEDLLQRLIVDREHSERRTALSGRRDAMKTITGRTALESAIETAREMIQQMDLVLADAGQDLRVAELQPTVAVQPVVRPAVKLPAKPARVVTGPAILTFRPASVAAAV